MKLAPGNSYPVREYQALAVPQSVMLDLFGRNIDKGETVAALFHHPKLAVIESHHVKRGFKLFIGSERPDNLAVPPERDQAVVAGIGHEHARVAVGAEPVRSAQGAEGRGFARTSAPVTVTLDPGTEVSIIKTKGTTWARVKAPDGRAWWIQTDRLAET